MLIKSTELLFSILLMSNKLLKLTIYILNTPLYWVSCWMPKSSNIWIFGAWFGEKYADNSKYLFEYVNRSHSEIRAIWFSTNKNVIRLLNQKGYEAYYTYSWKGYYFGAKARFAFVSVSITDINQYVCSTSRTIIVQLWHGTPLKKIHFDDRYNTSLNPSGIKHIIKSIKELFFPFRGKHFDYTISSSEIVSNCFHSAFRISKKNILQTGYPRNDALFFNKNTKKMILYLPTFRDKSDFNLFQDFSVSKMTKILEDNNINFYYKLHYADKNKPSIKSKRINQVHNIDLYELLSQTDILITDYSSVYFDFLLTDNPIIFTPFDLDEYIKQDRELYFNYHDVTPGPKCQNWDEVLIELKNIISGQDEYCEQRDIINKRFNTFQDGGSSKRVVEYILKHLK